jgi:hypothetical protein
MGSKIYPTSKNVARIAPHKTRKGRGFAGNVDSNVVSARQG